MPVDREGLISSASLAGFLALLSTAASQKQAIRLRQGQRAMQDAVCNNEQRIYPAIDSFKRLVSSSAGTHMHVAGVIL
jgi:hypothetical protein